MKFNIWQLVVAHHKTFVDARDDSVRHRDYVAFYGVPAVVLVACVLLQVQLNAVVCAALLTVCGLLGGFLFSVVLQTSERAMNWADTRPERGAQTSRHAAIIREIAANAGYSALVAIVASIAFVIASAAPKGDALVIASALSLAIGAHFVLSLLMVLSRVWAVTERQLVEARTNGNITRLDDRRNAS